MSEEAETKNITLSTTPFDARFPNTNQSKHCLQDYVDYYRCISAKGEDYAPCMQFKRNYTSLCPVDWVSSGSDDSRI
ncbi:cytochrome c oxidase-like protein polypeptide vib, partial [Syncephalis plumigaleata]